jgi:hypothetical protein
MDETKVWEMQEKFDLAAKMILSQLQMLIKSFVNLRDTGALTALQTCCNQLFKNASECLAENKFYEIGEDDESETLQ